MGSSVFYHNASPLVTGGVGIINFYYANPPNPTAPLAPKTERFHTFPSIFIV